MFERWSYHFAYCKLGRPGRGFPQPRIRDALAAQFVCTALEDMGYRYRVPILNYPWNADRPATRASRPARLTYVDSSRYGPNSIIVQPTRPAISDEDRLDERKTSVRSFTTLEEQVFDVARTYLGTCARTQVILKEWLTKHSAELARREVMEFRIYGGSTFHAYGPQMERRAWRRFRQQDRVTAVFLCYAEQAWPGGPAVLMPFGMSYMDTLVWCYRLANDFSHLLCTKSFVLAEMRRGAREARPASFDFANECQIDIVAAVDLPSKGDSVHAV